MTPSTLPVPASAIVWPSATTLSGSPGATSGQVIVMPSCSSDWPGTSASSARPEAENESPMPSEFPAAVCDGDVMPTLLKACARVGSDAAVAGAVNPELSNAAAGSRAVTAAVSSIRRDLLMARLLTAGGAATQSPLHSGRRHGAQPPSQRAAAQSTAPSRREALPRTALPDPPAPVPLSPEMVSP